MEDMAKKEELQMTIKRLEKVTRQVIALGASGIYTCSNNYLDDKNIWVFVTEKFLSQIVGDREAISWDGRDKERYPYRVSKLLQGIDFCCMTDKWPKFALGQGKESEKTTLCRQTAGDLLRAVHDLWALNPDSKISMHIAYSSYDNEFIIKSGNKVIYCSLLAEAAS